MPRVVDLPIFECYTEALFNQEHPIIAKENMITITDGALLLISLYSFWAGWQRGLFRALLGPLSLGIATAASYLYYVATKQMIISLLIGLIGPVVLNIVLSVVLSVWNKTVNQDQKLSSVSRTFGGIFNLVWADGLCLLVLIFLMVIPPLVPGIDKIQDDLNRSLTYSLVHGKIGRAHV